VSEPFAAECKEFVRSRLIGKQVLVCVEYTRDKRLYASVYYGKATRQPGGVTRPGYLISEQLVVEGLAQTVKHRPEEPRAEAYDTMLVDEAEAQRKKKGLHANPGAPAVESTARGINDLTSDGSPLPPPPLTAPSSGKKAKAFFNLLQRDKSFRAMVDYVFTGSRFKLTIPSENATLSFALAQVRCPSLAKPQANATLEEGEVPPAEDPLAVWGETAKKFSRLNVLQRMVDIEFTDIDRNGVMLGRIFLTGEKAPSSRAMRGHSYAMDLVREGLASVDK
jgi:staphylococcal nuclease domain-containing protein 1